MKSSKILGVILLISIVAVLGVAGYVLTRSKNVQPSPTPESTPSVKTEGSFSCGDSVVKDIDGNEYKTVKIGEQCWLKENLKVTKNPEGRAITRYCYDNDPKICETDGGLYDWNTAMNNSTQEGAQGICPASWHVPKDSEWYIIENYLKDNGQTCTIARIGFECATAGTKLKTGGSSGFEAVLAGTRDYILDGSFRYRGKYAAFWSSTDSRRGAWHRDLFSGSSIVSRDTLGNANGFSVRCLKD